MAGGQRVLTIYVGAEEHFNEETNEFVYVGGTPIQLEYSLAVLSKWESKFNKPFLGPQEKTREEVIGFIQEMIVTPEISPEIVQKFTEKNFAEVNEYMDSKQTATWFSDTPEPKTSREVITAELIYYWLVAFNIPWETQHWHLNKLFTLIKVFNAKTEKPKKMTPGEAAARRRQLNEQRKQQYKTSG
jgi:hypothetical protein